MCTFEFLYADGKEIKCDHIKSVSYGQGGSDVKEDELPTHKFLLQKTGLYLFSASGSCYVHCEGLRSFRVTVE